MTIWESRNYGASYHRRLLVDPGDSGYSSLQAYDDKLGLLYEQSDPDPQEDPKVMLRRLLIGSCVVQTPTRIVFRELGTDELQ